MNLTGRFSFVVTCRLVGTVGIVATWVSLASATLVNKYSFNDNTANDSVGGQNGVVVDNTGISRYTGGAFDISGNNGAGSNQNFSNPATVGAYIDLPNGVFTSAIDGGTFGAASLEVWFTTQQNRGWAEVFSFGTSAAGENLSTGEGSYVALIPQSGTNPTEFRASTRDQASTVESYINNVTPLPALPTSVKQHVVYVLDHNDTNGGINLNGTGRLYLNGVNVGSAEIATFLDSLSLSDVNNWLGRSQWPDPLYDGLIDEFRIYDHALTPAEVSTSSTTGPDPAPLPMLVVNRGTGGISLANQTAGNVQIKGYSVTSAAAALNPAAWTSIDAGNVFDPDGTWSTQSSTSMNLAESVTSGILDGGTLAPAASRGIGMPWIKTPIEDLAFSFTLGDGTTGFGQVQYVGNGGMPYGRSDLNGDGTVDVADWALFLPNSFTTFAGETAVGAYLKGDLDGDLDNDFRDFLLFKADFIAANGAGAFAALISGVPEPSSLVLLVTASAMLLGVRRDRQVTRRLLRRLHPCDMNNDVEPLKRRFAGMKYVLCTMATLVTFGAGRVVSADTVAYWRFETGPAGTPVSHTIGDGMFEAAVPDVSGNGNDLSAWSNGGFAGYQYRTDVPFSPVPQTGAANNFSVKNTGGVPGLFTDSSVSSPSGVDIETMTPAAFTIEASWKPESGGHRTVVGRDAQNVATADGALAALYLQARPDNSVGILFVDVAGEVHEAFSPPDVIAGFNFPTDPDGLTGTWYNLVGVSDGSTLSMYVNNALVATTPIVSADPRLAIGATSSGDWHAGGWAVGRGLHNGGHTDRAYGYIDEVRISNAALDPSEFLAAPEPTSAVLMMAAGSLLALARRKS